MLQMMFYYLRGEQLSQWLSDLNGRKDQENNLFEVITDFLKSTGQNQLINQVRTNLERESIYPIVRLKNTKAL